MVITYKMVDTANGALTGLTPTITVNGAASAGVNAEVGNGFYTYTPAVGEESASMVIRATATLAVPVEVVTSNAVTTVGAKADAAKASADLANRTAPDNAGIAAASAAATSAANGAALIRSTDFPALGAKVDATTAAVSVVGGQLYAAGAGSVSIGTPITTQALVERGTDAPLVFDADTTGRTSTLALYPQGNPTAALTVAGTATGATTTVSLTDAQTLALNGVYRMQLDSTLGSDTVRHIDGLLVAT
jgi:hypothetical protein